MQRNAVKKSTTTCAGNLRRKGFEAKYELYTDASDTNRVHSDSGKTEQTKQAAVKRGGPRVDSAFREADRRSGVRRPSPSNQQLANWVATTVDSQTTSIHVRRRRTLPKGVHVLERRKKRARGGGRTTPP
jgi:hypothetical protein